MDAHELSWVYPNKSINRNAADITITAGKPKRDYPFTLSIVIKNDCYKKLTRTERVQIALSGDRLYFRGAADGEKGYKLSEGSNPTTRYMSLVSTTLNLPKEVVEGSYKLQFDHQRQLPYIRLDKKL